MPVNRKKRQLSLGQRMAGAVLDLIDGFFRAIGSLFFGILRGIGRGLLLLLRGLLFLFRRLLRLICLPFAALYRHLTGKSNRASRCLRLTGEEFEVYAADILRTVQTIFLYQTAYHYKSNSFYLTGRGNS